MVRYSTANSPYKDVAKAVDLLSSALKAAPPMQVTAHLQRLRKYDKALRAQVIAKVDLGALYRASADAGDPVGMREYAKLRLSQSKAPNVVADANSMLAKAAAMKDVPAMLLLARNYAYGIGAPPSIDDARTWLRTASLLGSKEAQDMLSVMDGAAN